MIERNPTWRLVEEKQKELQNLVDQNWKRGEYHIAAVGERTLRAVTGALESSENMIDVTNTYLKSISRLQCLIDKYNSALQ